MTNVTKPKRLITHSGGNDGENPGKNDRRIRAGYFFRVLLLFLLGVGLATLHVALSFFAREYELERLALQRRTESLFREKQWLEVERRLVTEQLAVRERACRELELVEVKRIQCETGMVPEALVEKYRGAGTGTQLASVSAQSPTSLAFWQDMIEQIAAVTKVQAASAPEGSESNPMP